MFDLNKAENKARNSSHLNAERRVVRGVFFGFERREWADLVASSHRLGVVPLDVAVPWRARWASGTEIEEEAT